MKQNIIDRINHLANEKEPFLFVVNYAGSEAYIRKLSEIATNECLYDFEGITNVKRQSLSSVTKHPTWKVFEPNFEDYTKSFETVKSNILRGNSYLANLTCEVAVDCNLTLEDIFLRAKGKYKILLIDNNSNRRFVCFSPETFVKIKNGMIYSYPMKGTIDASLPEAEQVLMGDKKEAAEHATIVDLIRNDLSRVAEHVSVDKYRYIDVLHTNKGDILQTSSEISGKLPTGYQKHIGNILDAMLPAGSITGAPKDKTMEIIHEAEGYDRGFYTGVMGIYNNGELNSAVMIRFLENDGIGTYFKAGGGITSKSDCRKEYEEVLQKVYLPLNRTDFNMAQQFVETIKIKDGKAQALTYHQERMEKTICKFFPSLCNASMPSLEKLINPTESMDFYKARVVYGEQGVEAVEYAPYFIRTINSLQVVEDDTITYGYKSTDRSRLNALVAQKENCDEIIVVKHGLLTDTSFTNLAIFDGKHWVSPKYPLLPGTKRAALLDKGMIQKADITLEDLRNANKVSLFNAMIEFGEREIAIENVHF